MRIGQRNGVLAIEKCILGGKQFISVVLPARYGKSHVIRMTAGCMIDEGQACTALVLSPNTTLRDQMTDAAKLGEMFGLLQPDFEPRFKTFTMRNVAPRPNANGEWLISASIQLVQRNLDVFGQWVESEANRTGKPVLVYIDESHTGSTRNTWGGVAAALARHGAIIILLTATPYRADGELLHGFRTEVLSEEDYKKYVTRDGSHPDLIKVEVYEGSRRLVRLKADYEYKLKDAWDEKPLPIAKVEWLPFAVEMNKHQAGEPVEGKLLSDLPPTVVRKILGRLVRDPITVEHGVRLMIQKLRELKAKDGTISAIIFCGNDRDDDPDFNAHAKLILSYLKLFAPELKAFISTSTSDEDEDDFLERFRKGEGDVLIVKQRASVGLDVERLKVGLDLSPVRTRAAFHQRLMRIATVYKNFYGIYIAPDEPIGASLFADIVRDEGGEATVTDLEKVDETEVPRKDKTKEHYAVNGTEDADFGDSDENWADKGLMAKVLTLRQQFPELVGLVSHAVLAARIEQCGLEITVPTAAAARDYDTETQIFTLRNCVVTTMNDIVKRDRARRGLDKDDSEDYGATSRLWYSRLYNLAGVPFLVIRKQTDLAILTKLRAAAIQILADLDGEGVVDV